MELVMALSKPSTRNEHYHDPGPGEGDGRDWLRHELSCYPHVTAHVRQFLDSLYWRQRAVVTMTYGEGLTQDAVATRLGVAPRTVRRDLLDVENMVASLRARGKC